MEQEKEEQRNKRKKWLLLLLLLLLLFVLTVFIVLFILGLEAVQIPLGTVVPTIVLAPTVDEYLPLSLSVKVESLSNVPYSGVTVELHSDPRSEVTNDNGIAFFYDVEEGVHMIYAISSAGRTMASAEVEISENADVSEVIISGDYFSGYQIEVPTRVAVLELTFIIYGSYLKIDSTENGVITWDNEYTNNYGTFYADEYNIMTPSTNIASKDGKVIIPGIGVLLDDGTFVEWDTYVNGDSEGDSSGSDGDGSDGDGSSSGGDVSGSEGDGDGSEGDGSEGDGGSDGDGDDSGSGNYEFDDGMSVTPDGEIILSDGTVSDKDTSDGVYFGDDEVKDLIEDDDDSSGSSGGLLASRDDDDEDLVSGEDLKVSDDEVIWSGEASTDIKIFETSEGVVYPGSSGEYEFDIFNPNYYSLSCYLEIYENTSVNALTIPLVYQLKYYDSSIDDYVYLQLCEEEIFSDDETDSENETDEEDETSSEIDAWTFDISGSTTMTFVLEWTWPFEGNDEYDTSIGSSDNRDHEVVVTVYYG